MNFDTTVSRDSARCPGVRFVVRRLNQIERARRDLAIAEHTLRLTELVVQHQRLSEDRDKKAKPTAEEIRLNQEITQLVDLHVKPCTIKAGLVNIEGLEIDGVAATVESLLASGPEVLIEEIYDEAQKASGLTDEERKNLPSPSTSELPVVGGESNTAVGIVAA